MLRTQSAATGVSSTEERLSPIVRYVSLLFAVACVALTACSGQRDAAAARTTSVTGLRGTPLGEPLAKPTFVLTRTDGHAYDFARETQGKVALLFFGYTHCPDVCPLHMANIAAVLAKMPWEEREAIRVVFVTTDPERDTPERLGSWLAGFDREFVGLRGAPDTITAIQKSLGLVPASRQPSPDTSKEYLVGHAAQVIAFGRDNVARVVYPFGTRQDHWAHDLPMLARGEGNTPAATAHHDMQPDVSVLERAIGPAVIVAGTDGARGALYLTIQAGYMGDTLYAVTPIGGGVASLHLSTASAGPVTMKPTQSITIPASSLLAMQPGGMHVMLDSMPRRLVPGSSIALELELSAGKKVIVPGTVVTYAQLDSVLALVRASFVPR
ncbi:MAG: SCO family protein [Gemmatimonadaceae bacterium]